MKGNILKVGEIYRNDQFRMIYKILEIQPGGKVYCEYTRNGFTCNHAFDASQLTKSLKNQELFTVDQISIF